MNKKLFLGLLILSLPLRAQMVDRQKGFGFNVGSQGSGFMFDYIWEISPQYQLSVEGRFYDIRGESELPVFDYRGRPYTIAPKHLVMIPLLGGGKYFPFSGQIANNFAPFTTVKIGPAVVIDGREEGSFLDRWRKADVFLTLGGFAGVGVDFLNPSKLIISASAGYDILPMGKEVDGQENYNGLLINVAMNWRF